MSYDTEIIYALVARGTSVLSECFTNDSASRNAAQITRMLLNKISADDAKMSYESNEYKVHYIVSNAITYLCVSGNHMDIDSVFGCLHSIKDEFEERYLASAQTLRAYAINDEFMTVIGSQIEKANGVKDGDDMEVLKKKVQVIRKLAETNVESLLSRNEQIDMINTKSSRLNDDAKAFEKEAHVLKNHFFWKYLKSLLCLFCVLLLVIYLIISMICGFTFDKCS